MGYPIQKMHALRPHWTVGGIKSPRQPEIIRIMTGIDPANQIIFPANQIIFLQCSCYHTSSIEASARMIRKIPISVSAMPWLLLFLPRISFLKFSFAVTK